MNFPHLDEVIAGLAILLSLFAGISLLLWLGHRHKLRMRQLEKDEHLALADRGFASHLEHLGRATAEKARYAAVGVVGVTVGVVVPACAMLATLFLVMNAGNQLYVVAPLIVLWVMCGTVVLVTAILCMRALRPIVPPADVGPPPAPTEFVVSEKGQS